MRRLARKSRCRHETPNTMAYQAGARFPKRQARNPETGGGEYPPYTPHGESPRGTIVSSPRKGGDAMTMGQFPTLAEAIEHAKRMGGRIAHCDSGEAYWFAIGVWTMTPIMLHPVLRGKNAHIGSWREHEEGYFHAF